MRCAPTEFLEKPVPMIASLFTLGELVAVSEASGLSVTLAEPRSPYEGEHGTTRLYLEAVKGELVR